MRAEFHNRSRERLEKLTSGVNPATFATNQFGQPSGITIVKVGGGAIQGTTNGTSTGASRSELNNLMGTTVQTQRAGNITGATGSRSELNAYHRLSAVPIPSQKSTSLFLNGGNQRTEIATGSSCLPSSYMMTGSNIGQPGPITIYHWP